MENFLTKNRRSFTILFRNLFFFCLFLVLFSQYKILSVNKFINKYWLISLTIIFFFFFFYFSIKKNKKLEEKTNWYVKIIFPISLILTVIVSINLDIKNTLYIFLFNQKLYLSIVTTCLWFFIILFNKLNLEYKNNNKNLLFIIILFLVTITGLFIRLYRVDFLTPVTDEFYHLLAAKRYMLHGYYEYNRASFVSLFSGIIFSATQSPSILLAKIPSVIAGTIAIPLIYIWGKKINKVVGVVSATLLTFLPVAVGMSRYIREYIFFFSILTTYLIWLDSTMEKLFKKTKLKIAYLNLFIIFSTPATYYFFIEDSSFVILLYILLFLLCIINIIYEKINKIKKLKNKIFGILFTKWFLSIPIFLTIFIFLGFLYSKVSWLFNFNGVSIFNLPKLNYFNALFNPSFHPWLVNLTWFSISDFSVFIVFSFFLISTVHFIKNKYYLFNLLAFCLLFIPFLLFADRYYAIRYVFYALLFYTTIFSCSIYSIFKIREVYKNKFTKTIYIVVVVIFVINLFSPLTIIKNLQNEKIGETDPSKELLSYNYPELFKKLENIGFNDGDFIITSDGISNALSYYLDNYSFIENRNEHPLVRFQYKNSSGKLIPLNDTTTINEYYYISPYSRPCFDNVCDISEEDRIRRIIESQKKGWIIIDKDRNRNWNNKGFPLKNFTIGEKNILYIDSIAGYRGFDIYNWGY